MDWSISSLKHFHLYSPAFMGGARGSQALDFSGFLSVLHSVLRSRCGLSGFALKKNGANWANLHSWRNGFGPCCLALSVSRSACSGLDGLQRLERKLFSWRVNDLVTDNEVDIGSSL